MNSEYMNVLETLRDQIESGFLDIAPLHEANDPYREQWKKMFIKSLNAGIAALASAN